MVCFRKGITPRGKYVRYLLFTSAYGNVTSSIADIASPVYPLTRDSLYCTFWHCYSSGSGGHVTSGSVAQFRSVHPESVRSQAGGALGQVQVGGQSSVSSLRGESLTGTEASAVSFQAAAAILPAAI